MPSMYKMTSVVLDTWILDVLKSSQSNWWHLEYVSSSCPPNSTLSPLVLFKFFFSGCVPLINTQLSHGFTHLWNIRNSTECNRGKEGKLNGKKSEGETSHMRLLTPRKQTEGWGKGGGWGNGVTGWWALRRACDMMSTGCYIQLMDHWTLYQKLMMYYTLANWT